MTSLADGKKDNYVPTAASAANNLLGFFNDEIIISFWGDIFTQSYCSINSFKNGMFFK